MAHKMNYNPHLARGYPETIEQQIRTTYQGQAYFGNTGPFGGPAPSAVFSVITDGVTTRAAT